MKRKLGFEPLSRFYFEPLEDRRVLAAIVDSLALIAEPLALATAREAAYWPFSSDSPWNTSLGSGAIYAAINSPRFSPTGGANLNVTSWSIPVFIAGSNDPLRNFYDDDTGSTVIGRIRTPAAATPDSQSDGTLVVIDGDVAVEMWRAHKLSNGDWSASATALTNLTGTNVYSTYHGIRAGGMSALAGLIRKDELVNLLIPHALAIAVDPQALNKSPAFVWPASWADGYTSPGSGYGSSGNLHMGSLLAIAPSVNLGALGLSPQGLAVARAMQDYGAYIAETGGGNVIYYAEPAANSVVSSSLRGDLAKLTPYLQIISNNGATAIGGGGVPRAELAPPLGGVVEPPPPSIDPPPVQLFMISGTVQDTSGRLLENVQVHLFSGSTYLRTVSTNSNGYYAFSDVPVGTYRVGAGNTRSYYWSEAELTVDGDEGLDLVLSPKRRWRR